jgi:hypothetical protein
MFTDRQADAAPASPRFKVMMAGAAGVMMAGGPEEPRPHDGESCRQRVQALGILFSPASRRFTRLSLKRALRWIIVALAESALPSKGECHGNKRA